MRIKRRHKYYRIYWYSQDGKQLCCSPFVFSRAAAKKKIEALRECCEREMFIRRVKRYRQVEVFKKEYSVLPLYDVRKLLEEIDDYAT